MNREPRGPLLNMEVADFRLLHENNRVVRE